MYSDSCLSILCLITPAFRTKSLNIITPAAFTTTQGQREILTRGIFLDYIMNSRQGKR
uniref:Uncharacterized protein n=1 Tax=Picea sitchensis TaxID=3332 RepID=A0A6B9XT85_PICSI|nr:hypothetical protein Q903MT_gene4271 [Picea sitchensis]